MGLELLLLTLAALTAGCFAAGRWRALRVCGGDVRALHSLPGHYGWYASLWCGLPGLAILLLWLAFAPPLVDRLTLAAIPGELSSEAEAALLLNDVKNAARGEFGRDGEDERVRAAARHYERLRGRSAAAALALGLALAGAGGGLAVARIRPALAARVRVENALRALLMASSTLAILVTVGIVLSLVFETVRFFQKVPAGEFLFGLHWSPQMALRADQVGSSGSFGAVPVFLGTLLVTLIAILVAAPIGLLSAVYMTFYARLRLRALIKPALEILAGVPTVVYGFFAALIVAPFVRDWGAALGLGVASESALAAGLVMGIMIVPFISSLSDDAITAVPEALRDGAFALGATRAETIRSVIIPAALPGIVGAFLLAISRAIGETMIVVMAAGLAANLTVNPLEAVTTVTVQIVTLLTGDQEFDSAKTLAAFALGLVLFFVTLGLNLLALRIVQKYRERYD